MRSIKIIILLIISIYVGPSNAQDQTEEAVIVSTGVTEKKDQSNITVSDLTILLKMSVEDLTKLLDAAGIITTGVKDVIDDEEKIKLVKFLESKVAEAEIDNSDCKKGEMLFCETERRVSDRRFGRNKSTDDKRCACGPMFGRF
jgi:hypothetical protein